MKLRSANKKQREHPLIAYGLVIRMKMFIQSGPYTDSKSIFLFRKPLLERQGRVARLFLVVQGKN